MYRKVKLVAEDKDYHRIRWKVPNTQDVKTYRTTLVFYGTASSVFHSIRPLQVLAEVNDKSKQLSILSDMYVDLMKGAANI